VPFLKAPQNYSLATGAKSAVRAEFLVTQNQVLADRDRINRLKGVNTPSNDGVRLIALRR
jgi:hypothetical protein